MHKETLLRGQKHLVRRPLSDTYRTGRSIAIVGFESERNDEPESTNRQSLEAI